MARRVQLSRNMKQLSIAIPSSSSSTPSRRPSVVSLPAISVAFRANEDHSPSTPYANGPVQIIPGIWLGSEDNARDWSGLTRRRIFSILNVAREVSLPFDILQPSSPPFYYPPHKPSGRPPIYYLKLQWSHGQQNLVDDGFKQAMAFTDAALQRGDGILIHCQCGISRSATLVIALVMRAAAERASSVPPEVWSLKGMHDAYSYVKEKSKWISPNMSLIYQLLEYQKRLKSDINSIDSSDFSPPSVADEEEEWGRQRLLMDEQDRDSTFVLHEAQALDKAMEDRFIARRSSSSSLCSSNSGHGMGLAWRSRYASRKRTASVASCRTNGSILSENLVEQDEEAELLGVGGGFDSEKNAEESSSSTTSPDEDLDNEPSSSRILPSASVHRTAFRISSFNVPRSRAKRRPPPIGLPTVPSSPITIIVDSPTTTAIKGLPRPSSPRLSVSTPIQRGAESPRPLSERKYTSSSLQTPNRALRKTRSIQDPIATPSASSMPQMNMPSQTLFVFPPSPTAISTPSTLTITSTPNASLIHFPSTSWTSTTPRSRGRPRSIIGVSAPATPTTAFTKLNVRGYVKG